MKIPDHVRLFLLRIIESGGNIQPLVEMGYEYSQIVTFIKNEIAENNASFINGELVLTKEGKEITSSLQNTKVRKNGSNTWIEPEIQSKISQIDIDDVYLPNQNDLWFN